MKKKIGAISGGPIVGGLRVVRIGNQQYVSGTYYYEVTNGDVKISLVPGIL